MVGGRALTPRFVRARYDRSMDELARHLAAMAQLCADIRTGIDEVTTVERLDGTDPGTLCRLLPSVAERHGVEVRCAIDDGVATVRFRRRHARAA